MSNIQNGWAAAAGLTIEQWARERLLTDLTGTPAAADPGASEERWMQTELRKRMVEDSRRLLEFTTTQLAQPWLDPISYRPPTTFAMPRAERPNFEDVISEVEPASIWGTTSAPEAPMLTEELMLAAIDQLRGKRRKPSARPEQPTQPPPLALHPPKPRKILV